MSPAETKIAKLLAEAAGLPAERVAPNSDLFRDLGIDSLNFVEALVAVEAEFCIEIPTLRRKTSKPCRAFRRGAAPGRCSGGVPGEAPALPPRGEEAFLLLARIARRTCSPVTCW